MSRYNLSNYMKKRQISPKQNPSKVLLVCVYDTIVLELNNQIIYARFAPFGYIIKILIFERGEVTKFFIEFAYLPDAENAKNALDGAKLYETICKMSIYYSNFRSVDLKHETTEGVSLEPLLQVAVDPYFSIYQSQFSPYMIFQQNNSYCNEYFKQPLPPSKNIVGQQLHEFNNQGPEEYTLSSPNSKSILRNSIESKIQNDIDWLLRSGQKKQETKQLLFAKEGNHIKGNEKSCYICFALTSQLSIRNVYNLFSNFGNISFIKKTKKQIFIKFRTHYGSETAKDYLEGYMIKKNALNLNIMKQISAALPTEDQYAEITYYDSTFDRLEHNVSSAFRPPCQTLHISSLQRSIYKAEELKYIFEEFGMIDEVQITCRKQTKKTAMIRFEHIQDSIDALSQMHGVSLSGKRIQICFGKSTLS